MSREKGTAGLLKILLTENQCNLFDQENLFWENISRLFLDEYDWWLVVRWQEDGILMVICGGGSDLVEAVFLLWHAPASADGGPRLGPCLSLREQVLGLLQTTCKINSVQSSMWNVSTDSPRSSSMHLEMQPRASCCAKLPVPSLTAYKHIPGVWVNVSAREKKFRFHKSAPLRKYESMIRNISMNHHFIRQKDSREKQILNM